MPRMRHAPPTLLFLALVSSTTAVAQPAPTGELRPPRSPRNASYTISARLDPATHTITGSEVIVWRNITKAPARDLQFHLYWNAWKNTRSTFMRERALGSPGAAAADASRSPDEWGRIDVGSIKVRGRDRTGCGRFP